MSFIRHRRATSPNKFECRNVYSTNRIDVEMKAAQNDPVVQEAVSKVDEALGDTGRILVRESGTEPVVRVMVEAPDHDTCQKYVDEVVNVICEKGYKA